MINELYRTTFMRISAALTCAGLLVGCAVGPQPLTDDAILYSSSIPGEFTGPLRILPIVWATPAQCADDKFGVELRDCTEEEVIAGQEYWRNFIIDELKNHGYRATMRNELESDRAEIGIRYTYRAVPNALTGQHMIATIDALSLLDGSLLYRVEAEQNQMVYMGRQTLQGALVELARWLDDNEFN